jgi:DNA-binding LacI/PurR family transcriptional regulator/signal transduction histidine kinase
MSRRLNIGVVTRYTEASYHGTLLEGIHQTAMNMGAKLFVINTFMLCRFHSENENGEIYYPLAFNHIDGWVVFSEGASDDYLKALYKSGKPIVFVGIEPGEFNCSVIKEDNYYGAELITQHLIDHGHTKIAHISWFDLNDMVERFEGYKKTLLKNRMPLDPDLVVKTDAALLQSGKEAAKRLIKTGKPFTAVFAGNDNLAVGVIEALKEVGLRIREDVAVVGYDDVLYAKQCTPKLTTMHQNIIDIGIEAAKKIISEIRGTEHNVETIYVKSNLVCRNSCGCEATCDNEDLPTMENYTLKNSMIKCLEDTVHINAEVGARLLTTNIDEIKKLLPNIILNYKWECIAFWEENSNDDTELIIRQVLNRYRDVNLTTETRCLIEDFPPEEFLPGQGELSNEDIIWIIPISTSAKKWGVMSYISPFNKVSTLFAYNFLAILLTFLGIAMDRDVATTELKNTLATLRQTLDTLQQTQEQLIQSEKMVSIGGLVAGIAHEINTPIGISVTAASFMQERSLELMESFKAGKLKRMDLEKYLELNAETNRIMLLNLNKASHLIHSFKQVSVDQSLEERRRFNLKEYINEVLLSLNPKLKKTRVCIHLDCPEDLDVYSYPGGIYQIITNMVVNSIMHAFDKDEEGNIFICASIDHGMITFIFSDDGKGIPKNNLNKIFDPFFTTRRGAGGTGLGLNIIYNLVTQKYGGSITCESEVGKGTTFLIKFPLKG